MTTKLKLLSLLGEVTSDTGLAALRKALCSDSSAEIADGAAAFYRELCLSGENTAAGYLSARLLEADTTFARAAARGEGEKFLSRIDTELKILKEFIETDSKTVKNRLPEDARAYFPVWESGKFAATARELCREFETGGYGAFRRSALILDEKTGEIVPVRSTSAIRLSDLKEYAEEKNAAVQNTLAFIEGKPANNVLFYGDRGTGKSSTVHALLNEFYPRGLRLLQISKSAIPLFPQIKAQLAAFPYLHFIIYLDDLTFEDNDSSFAALKAALEGSLATADNALIYVTTNRRHLVKESRSAREGDDVHAGDTMEEQLSLFDRFGLVITYIAPDKREYVSILTQILADRGIKMAEEEIASLAERFALRKGGRSPRAAKQLADMIESGIY